MKRIIIVDTDEQVNAVLELKLKAAGFDARSLANSVDALSLVREFKPDLIISEMVLPDLSGVDFLKRMKMNPDTASVPFIFLSSSNNVEDKIIAHEMGADAFFAKPIFIKVLINRIRDLFEQLDFNAILSSGEANSFSGNLVNITLIDLLNIIGENRRAGKVELSFDEGESGVIYFSEGEVLRVESESGENESGDEIMLKFLGWLDGTFNLEYGPVSVERNIEKPLNRIVLEAMNWMQDYTDNIGDLPPLDTKLYLDFRMFVENLSKLPDNIGMLVSNVTEEGTTVNEFLSKSELDKNRTSEYLKKLLELGIFVYEKSESTFELPPKPSWLKTGDLEGLPGGVAILEELEVGKEENELQEEESVDVSVEEEGAEQKEEIIPEAEEQAESVEEIAEQPEKITAEQDAIPEQPEKVTPEAEEFPEIVDRGDVSVEVAPAEELKSILDEEASNNHEVDKLFNESHGRSKRMILSVALFFILIILVSGGILLKIVLFPEKEEKQPPVAPKITVTKKEKKSSTVSIDELSKTEEDFSGKSVEDISFMAQDAFSEKDYAEAARFYRIALFKASGKSGGEGNVAWRLWKNLSIAYYYSENYRDALSSVEKSLLLNRDVETLELKASILEDMKEYEKAISVYEELTKESGAEKGQVKAWQAEVKRLQVLKNK